VVSNKFFSRISTTAVYPGVDRSEVECWLNEIPGHIMVVHLIGDMDTRNEQRRTLRSVVKSSERFEMCDADTAPMALIFQKMYNRVTMASLQTADMITSRVASAVFEIHRIIEGVPTAPYAVGVVQTPPQTSAGASDFKDTMTFFHNGKVSFVSVHGITTAMVDGMRAHLLLCNPIWRNKYITGADTAVAEEGWTDRWESYIAEKHIPPGQWEWAAVPHFLLALIPVENRKLPSLNKCMHVEDAMPIGGLPVTALHKLPTTFLSGPSVTFPPGVEGVTLDGTTDEDSNTIAAPGDRRVVNVRTVFQDGPTFFEKLHVVQACFGKYDFYVTSG